MIRHQESFTTSRRWFLKLPYTKEIYLLPYSMQESFLYSFKSLEPDLCITAAYGNILPSRFLKIPSMGKSKDFYFSCYPCFVFNPFWHWFVTFEIWWPILLKIRIKVSYIWCLFLGTVNIHPSLLPLYRGAAPVQRALQVNCH